LPDDHGGLKAVCKGKAYRVGVKGSQPSFIEHFRGGERQAKNLPIVDHASAVHLVFEFLLIKWVVGKTSFSIPRNYPDNKDRPLGLSCI
jgi:hypothetical protein